MTITWNQKSDSKLFSIFLKVHKIKPDYEAMMKEWGEGITKMAIQKRIQAIRQKNDDKGATDGHNESNSTTANANKKPAKTTTAMAKAGGRATKKRPQPQGELEESELDGEENPDHSGKRQDNKRIKLEPDY